MENQDVGVKFLDEEEELVTFYRLYYNEVGKDLSKS